MTDERLLNESGGVKTWFSTDPMTGCIIIRYQQDVEDIINGNIAMQNSGHDGFSPSRDLRHVASIPLGIYLTWLQEGFDLFNPDDAQIVRRKLNDPDYRHLRTGLGVI